MNLDILSLYKKAQNGGLSAQEVFWLESQQSEHPYFAMAYAVLARHHYRNQSTIRNRALLKGAAFALNRSLLRNYLEDTLVAPKHKPVPVADMKPILEEKDKVEEKQSPVEEVFSAEIAETAPTIVVESQAEPIVDLNAEPVIVHEAEAIVEVEAELVEEATSVVPVLESAAEIVVETAEPVISLEKAAETPVAEPIAPVVERPEPVLAKAEAPSTEGKQLGTTASDINWFLNMRLKLRIERHKYWVAKVQREMQQFAQAAQQAPVAVVETPKIEAQQAASQPADVQPATPSSQSGGGKQANKKGKLQQDLASAESRSYEIGGFSGITFLDIEDADVTEDEIDTGIATLEAIEFNTTDDAGEIIMEEDDRIVEVTVSPEALNKYFKGRLPGDNSFSFGEFHIELDEEEYHALDEQLNEADPREEGKKAEKNKLDALIDKFIENEPGISRAKDDYLQLGDLAKGSNSDDNEWVTETLAKIYEKQGNIGKAIKIYQKLSLRFPEKRDYFASLIENLKR